MHQIYGRIPLPLISNILDFDGCLRCTTMNWASFQSIWLAQKRFFCNQYLKVVTRVRLITAIVINLLLWGRESWALTAGQRNNLNVRFNSWTRLMSRMTKLDLRIISIRDEELRKRLGIESSDEI